MSSNSANASATQTPPAPCAVAVPRAASTACSAIIRSPGRCIRDGNPSAAHRLRMNAFVRRLVTSSRNLRNGDEAVALRAQVLDDPRQGHGGSVDTSLRIEMQLDNGSVVMHH